MRSQHSEVLASTRNRVDALGLDLRGLKVVTEAATGAYSVTAVIAAMAGARAVHVFARDTTRHGAARDAIDATLSLARAADLDGRLVVEPRIDRAVLADCDILTNAGHLRPIGDSMIRHLPKTAVIALMYEAWEFRGADIDLAACRRRGIRIAAVNERHPDVAVFPFLGPLCVRLLAEAGFDPAGLRIALICDNPFREFVRGGLVDAGSKPVTYPAIRQLEPGNWDAVVIAVNPAANVALGPSDFALLSRCAPGAVVAQFWGDVDRAAASAAGFRVVPVRPPRPGHMGMLLDALGFEPIVRLQAGGLRAAESVYRGTVSCDGGVAQEL